MEDYGFDDQLLFHDFKSGENAVERMNFFSFEEIQHHNIILRGVHSLIHLYIYPTHL